MDDLFDTNADFSQLIKRNIVSLRKSEDLFDDLYDMGENYQAVAQAVETRIKQHIPPGIIERGFHYTTAIGYPFIVENFQATRFSDGSFGCWYGSLDLETSIHETAFHALRELSYTPDITEIIYRERAIYDIYCQGILLDLRHKVKLYPALIANDYLFTQTIGKRLAHEGHPGLLARSARQLNGVNVVVFNKRILSKPRLNRYLNYMIDPIKKQVRVELEKQKTYLEVAI